jgi:hypothetical protein
MFLILLLRMDGVVSVYWSTLYKWVMLHSESGAAVEIGVTKAVT